MAATSRQHRGEKRRKELARKARQDQKRQRKAQRKLSESGAGPPIDWEATEAGSRTVSDPGSETKPATPSDTDPT
jgi:hypothetical protein